MAFRKFKYIGDPINAVKIFNELNTDELFLLDITATKENRIISTDFVKKIGEEANMPFAVGGGIKTIQQITDLVNAGAERVIINTTAGVNPDFISSAAATFGSSTIVVCIDVKKDIWGKERAWISNGNKAIRVPVIEFATLMQNNGAGEIVVQSINRDGMMNGYDINLIKKVAEAVTIPVVALGGAGKLEDMQEAHVKGFANGLASGSLFVYEGNERGVLINYPERKIFKSI